MDVILTCWAVLVDILKSDTGKIIGPFLAALGALRLAIGSLSEFRKSYLLLSRFNRRQHRRTTIEVLVTVVRTTLQDRTFFTKESQTLNRRIRVRMEHEIFSPKPVFEWPLSNDHDNYADESMSAGLGARGRKIARKAFRAELGDWVKGMEVINSGCGEKLIVLDNPAQINERMDEIKYYFDVIKSIGSLDVEADRFICAMEIRTGFIAPLHLLTGLLIKFNDKWPDILEGFDRDAQDIHGLDFGRQSLDLRQIQLFIYNCWLLWGPSIPICNCRMWDARYQVVQYGFGDENNSIEVVGRSEDIHDGLRKLFAAQDRDSRLARLPQRPTASPVPWEGMAIPANVLGHLRLSGSLKASGGQRLNALPSASLGSWGGGQDERPILFISDISRSDPVLGPVRHHETSRGRIDKCHSSHPSRYYSAYLWVGFVLLGKDAGDVWKPVSTFGGKSRQAWKDLIPFFEHGNLADAETCLFSKKQLASKTLAAFANLVRLWPPSSIPHRFGFACAIDEGGCGQDLSFPDWRGGISLREHMVAILEDGADRLNDVTYARLRDEKIIDFEYFHSGAVPHDYSACSLPSHIRSHYETFGR